MNFWQNPVGVIEELLSNLLFNLGASESLSRVILYSLGAFTLATLAMLFVLFLIWVERKIVGRVQDRFGPNRIGPWGLFQSIADMIKIFTKEHITPAGADVLLFNLAPIISMGAVLMVWSVIPFAVSIYGANLNAAVLYIVAVGALGEMGVVLAGWGSNNKFALLAAFRAVAQLISYEVPLVVSLLIPVMLSGSMGLNDIVMAQGGIWYILIAPAAALIFFISSVAEVGRAPFDLVESESELVAGFNIEYSGLKFGMFFVADFLHAFTISLLFATFFLGGWQGPGADTYPLLGLLYYLLKTSLVYFVIILMRAALPRFRIDQMMDLNWKILTPLSLSIVAFTGLVDKLIPGGWGLLKIGVMLLVNAILFWITVRLINRFGERHPRRQVAAAPRPVAIYQPPRSDTGA
jgi:NADH-quinone oxidoreductase subunit H